MDPIPKYDDNYIKCHFFLLILDIGYFKEENHSQQSKRRNKWIFHCLSCPWTLAIGAWMAHEQISLGRSYTSPAFLTQVPILTTCEASERIVSDESERSTLNKTKCLIMLWSCQQFKDGLWCTWALYNLPNANKSEPTTIWTMRKSEYTNADEQTTDIAPQLKNMII